MSEARKFALAVAAALMLYCHGYAAAGTIRHDVDDSLYTALANESQFASVGIVNTGAAMGSGTLVAPNYVLTAAHVGDTIRDTLFVLPDGSYARAWKVVNPSYTGDLTQGNDLVLLRLERLVLNVAPSALYTSTDEIGQTGTIVGYGRTGTGLTGDTLAAGTKRAGRNVFDASGTALSYSSKIMLADFDRPTPPPDNWFGSITALDMEYLTAPGDSGGGVFFETAGGWKLAGVVSFATARDGSVNSDYGDAMGVVRVSSHLSWINSVLAQTYTMDWIAASGAFNVGANWQTTFSGSAAHAVPGPLDAVRFASAGSHNVTFPAGDLTNTRLSVNAGAVGVSLGGRSWTLTDTSSTSPSLAVGESAGVASLTFTGGQVNVSKAVVAPVAGAQSTLIIGSGGMLASSGALYVGGSVSESGGTGEFVLAAGGSAAITQSVKAWAGGTVRMSGGDLTAYKVLLEGGTLTGRGTVAADVEAFAGGRVALGTGAGNGVLRVAKAVAGTAKVSLLDDSFLDVDVSASRCDLLEIDGMLQIRQEPLSGSAGAVLRITGDLSANGYAYQLAAFDSVQYLTGSVVHATGSFDQVLYNGVPVADPTAEGALGGTHQLVYDATGIRLVSHYLAGDVNLDGSVDGGDLSSLGLNWSPGSAGKTWAHGDFNGDGAVDGADLAALGLNWSPGGYMTAEQANWLAVGAVPEPATLATLLLGTLGMLARRRRQ